MRCLIYGDSLDTKYDAKKATEIDLVLKRKTFDLAFGLGLGQIRAIGFTGAYNEFVVEKIIKKRLEILDNLREFGQMVRVKGVNENELTLLLDKLRENGVIRLVDELSEKDFLVSGEKDCILLLKNHLGSKVSELNRGGLHTILFKEGIEPYAELLREFLIFPFKVPIIGTRNARLLKQDAVPQELVDSLTLPQHFMASVKFAYLLGVRDFVIVQDEFDLKNDILSLFNDISIVLIDELTQAKALD